MLPNVPRKRQRFVGTTQEERKAKEEERRKKEEFKKTSEAQALLAFGCDVALYAVR